MPGIAHIPLDAYLKEGKTVWGYCACNPKSTKKQIDGVIVEFKNLKKLNMRLSHETKLLSVEETHS